MTMASEVSDFASSTANEVAEVAQDQYDRLIAGVRRSPLQSAGIAAAIGFVLALLERQLSK
jgi:ElaB/YqjD/DUF883 family membrane-anchored ribosome-binding protein